MRPRVKIDKYTMRDAAVEAVENAVKLAEDNGFNHSRADDLCIGVVSVEADCR